jgi:hypothetical protein
MNTLELIRYKRVDDCLSHEYFENIVEMPFGIQSVTLQDLLKVAKQHLGERAVIDLRREIVTAFDCFECGESHSVLKPLAALSEQDRHCPYCGGACSPMMTHLITGEESFLDLTPVDLGIPPLDIIIARNQDRYLFLEFSADAASLLDFT